MLLSEVNNLKMGANFNSRKLHVDFEDYQKRVFLKNLSLILSFGILTLVYYMYSDWSVRHNLSAAETRIVPLLLSVVLLLIHLIFRHKFYRLKLALYLLFFVAAQLMMYGKCLIHLHEEALAPSVTGAILVIFLMSLDLRQNLKTATFVYIIPIVVFSLSLIFWKKPTSSEFFVLVDIYPIVIVGFIINRLQYNLRFRLFKSNQLLKLEQEKTKALYKESLVINDELKKKAEEAICIKEEIQEKNEELNKSNATKDRFLTIIAHDLKNPIGNIWGLSDLLLVDKTMDENGKYECLDAINKSIQHTYELLDNLLNWARAQNKAIAFNPLNHKANEVVERELIVFRQVADKKTINIKNSIPDEFEVFADKNMLETIIRNLVSNAIKYSYPKGEIEISATIVTKDVETFTQISIKDNGIGMSHDTLMKLFSSNKNISTRGTENESGTGFGLLLCKEFLDIHKGDLTVQSIPNKGSVFSCNFPVLN